MTVIKMNTDFCNISYNANSSKMKFISVLSFFSFVVILVVLLSSCVDNSYNQGIRHNGTMLSMYRGQNKIMYTGHIPRAKNIPYNVTKSNRPWNEIQPNMEEAIFLDDIVFKIQADEAGNVIGKGHKLFFKNNVTTQLFAFDNRNLMTEKGVCRARLSSLQHYNNDQDNQNNIHDIQQQHDSCAIDRSHISSNDIKLDEFTFHELEDWAGDDFSDAMFSFLRTCEAIRSGKQRNISSASINLGNKSAWINLCSIAFEYNKLSLGKAFFERYFSPMMLRQKSNNDSKFTGYYIWELPISLKPNNIYRYPIYSPSAFCKKETSSCPSRSDIYKGALQGMGLEIAWAKNPMDIYFMQVQGSGVGVTEDGQYFRFMYAGKNDKKFNSFTKYMTENPGFSPYTKYHQVADWLYANPQKALEATSVCDSYVFFKLANINQSVKGSSGASLSQSRSIAVDPKYIPYGSPVWIETSMPVLDEYEDIKNGKRHFLHFNRLWVAQDTGSAIKGAVRADLYFGHGKKAEFLAKNMNFPGRLFILVPNFLIKKPVQNSIR